MSPQIHEAGRGFIQREGRVLEQRLAATVFDGAPAAGVVDALRGYQNPDGGFGHGLEPDKRCPDSLAVDVSAALQAMDAAGTVDHQMVGRACDFLASIATTDGAVALASPVMEAYPRAVHWSEWTYEPGFNPTAGLAGLLHRMEVDHPFRAKATEWCWSALAEVPLPDDAHAVSEILLFLGDVPDRARADALAPDVVEHLAKTNHYRSDPHDPAYGVTPLHVVPTPSSRWRPLFADDLLEGHLDRLERDQQADGGWAITWEPPSAASTLEYRAIMTLWALRVLRAHGR
ncbi:MAG TPA: hypothetical protein VF244_09365 [Acidimicrobiales bacterium]